MVTITVVPEPASLVLLGTGLLAPLGAWWLRRRSRPRAGADPDRRPILKPQGDRH